MRIRGNKKKAPTVDKIAPDQKRHLNREVTPIKSTSIGQEKRKALYGCGIKPRLRPRKTKPTIISNTAN